MKKYYLAKNKYIRLQVVKYYAYFRAEISVNKYGNNEKVPCRYYEVNYEIFHPYDYEDENDALKNAIDWLNNEVVKFQEKIKDIK